MKIEIRELGIRIDDNTPKSVIDAICAKHPLVRTLLNKSKKDGSPKKEVKD